MSKGRLVGLVTVVVLAAWPAAASALTRYTSPGGTSTSGTCTDPAGACRIDHAFSVLASSDELVLAPGDYGSPSAPITQQLLNGNGGLNVHATRGAPARIYSSFSPGNLLQLNGSGNQVRD